MGRIGCPILSTCVLRAPCIMLRNTRFDEWGGQRVSASTTAPEIDDVGQHANAECDAKGRAELQRRRDFI